MANQPDLPESAQQVLRTLREGPMTNKDLVERTGIARRTLGRTLHRLLDIGMLMRIPSLVDTRRFYYKIAE
jgi:DNA-binding MarR family transcriptional regulator